VGKYLNLIRQTEEPDTSIDHGRSSEILPGCQIIWDGADTLQRGPAIIDFLHTDPDGTAWAFYTLPDGNGGTVNMKYVTVVEQDG